MSKTISAKIMGKEAIQVSTETTLYELSKMYTNQVEFPILLAKVNNDTQELHKTLIEDCEVEFLDITSSQGFRAYQRSVVFLLLCAAKEILGEKTRVVVGHSIKKNYYCEIPEAGVVITEELLQQIEDKMYEIVEENVTIEKHSIPVEEAIKISKELGLRDKEQILRYRRTANVNFYKLKWFYDYFYGPMVPNTACLTMFKLHMQDEGFMLQFPDGTENFSLPEMITQKKITGVIRESNNWAKILKIDTVGALNDVISNGGLGDVIRITEALHEKKIGVISDMIHEQLKSIVLIAGPSSSGKTTFAERLCTQLRVNGIIPYIISLDDYLIGSKNYPRDEFGNPDMEHLETVDIKQINEDLLALLEGQTVQIPTFNFKNDRREYTGRYLKLNEGEVLVVEGIHALNEKLTCEIPRAAKFKIFISALTQLNIDDHNRIPTTDTRLIRRIVRDSQYRKIEAARNIGLWTNVLRGENENIFPFQEEADAFFNSALVYEMCILKQYVEPLLFKIERKSPEYTEARRLIKFLDSFLGCSSEAVPPNSILREFVGGSCFNT